MGNSQNPRKHIKVTVEMQRPFYNSGSNLQGTIFLESMRRFPYDALIVRVEGYESCQWFEGSSKNQKRYTGSHMVYCLEHVIEKFEDAVLEPGRYAYPFSIELAASIPGSITYDGECRASIDYKLVAYLAHYESEIKMIVKEAPILIREPFRMDMTSFRGEITASPLKWAVFSVGMVTLVTEFQRNVCFEGEDLNLRIACNNIYGQQDINTIVVDVVQYIFVASNSGNSKTIRTVISSDRIPVSFPSGQELTHEHTLTVPIIPNSTAIGTLVASYYQIEVSTTMGVTSRDNPCVASPCFIMKNEMGVPECPKSEIDIAYYDVRKMMEFRAPEYWFKRNTKLAICNFKRQERIGEEVRRSQLNVA